MFDERYFECAYGQDYERRNPPRKLDFYLKRIRALKPKGSLIDIGCAYGSFLTIARKFYDVSGCDISGHALESAKKKLPGVPFVESDLQELELEAAYDVVTCFDVLEHIPALQTAMERLKRLMKPDGIVVIAVPVYDTMAGRIAELLDRDKTHLWKQGRKFWRDLVISNGMQLVEEAGLWRYLLPWGKYLFFGGVRWRTFSPALLLIAKKS